MTYSDLIERLELKRDVWRGTEFGDDICELLDEASDALRAAQRGLRYAVRVWVMSDEIAWSEEEINEVVESIISDAKRRTANEMPNMRK